MPDLVIHLSSLLFDLSLVFSRWNGYWGPFLGVLEVRFPRLCRILGWSLGVIVGVLGAFMTIYRFLLRFSKIRLCFLGSVMTICYLLAVLNH